MVAVPTPLLSISKAFILSHGCSSKLKGFPANYVLISFFLCFIYYLFLLQGKKKGRPAKKEILFRKETLGLSLANPGKQANPQKRRKRDGIVIDGPCNTTQAHSTTYQRAKEVQATLSPLFPSLIKSMLPSHVTGGFWLGLPTKFCQLHMPKVDTIFSLEDESGQLYETKYLTQKAGLSGGWRGFSMAHNLLEMDVLIFHLVQPSKFKVYIIRSQGSDEVDGALGLLKLDECRKQTDEVNGVLDTTEGNDHKNSEMVFGANVSQLDEVENTSEDLVSGIKFSESVVSFKQVNGVENFRIVVNGLVIDSELSQYDRGKYYELCLSQGSFLHEQLFEGLNSKLAAGIISETINIADAIKGSNLTTSPDGFAIWDKTLKAFGTMGMNVGFLLNRLDQLMKLALKLMRYKEVILERDRAEEELKALEAKLVQVKQTINRLDQETDIQRMHPDRLKTMFQQLAHAPW
ncbi:B3 domain-containing protein Os01g0234100 isoform X2 [Cajanus cajan]|uniref:B3 domain-containing protein Os01g0234100 isoform X2 n=1 Tax=Cajanus cajan TaxID=3821 RepID=UPI0010FB4046|nr:B3 domain-containing protein Os01g0234100 isoform X2 [Cajanus cajan]